MHRGIQQMRPRLAIALSALVLAMSAVTFTQAASAWSFPAQQIADRASAATIGSWGGQCKPWAAGVVNSVLAANGISARVGGYGSPGGAYYGAYQNAGGTLVGINDGQPGDLIQTINAAQKNSDNPSLSGLHTAIIVARTSTPGTYIVRDSNWGLNEKIQQHSWAPASYAAAKGATAYIWRFGQAGSGGALWFVKTRNTGSGKVEVFSTAGSNWNNRSISSATVFSPADANNGWFQIDNGTLWFIKTKNTGSGKVEIFSTAGSNWNARSVSSTTTFSPADANNGWFRVTS